MTRADKSPPPAIRAGFPYFADDERSLRQTRKAKKHRHHRHSRRHKSRRRERHLQSDLDRLSENLESWKNIQKPRHDLADSESQEVGDRVSSGRTATSQEETGSEGDGTNQEDGLPEAAQILSMIIVSEPTAPFNSPL